MYVTVRQYAGVTDPSATDLHVSDGFLPLISQVPGFVAYCWADAGGGVMISTSVFQDQASAEGSNRKAADYVQANLATLLPNPPQITTGEVVAYKHAVVAINHPAEQMPSATVRRYEGVTNPSEAGQRVNEGFVPLISQVPGFVAYCWADAGGGVMISTSVFQDQASAEESNRKAADYVQTNLATLLPNPPQIITGEVAVAAYKSAVGSVGTYTRPKR